MAIKLTPAENRQSSRSSAGDSTAKATSKNKSVRKRVAVGAVFFVPPHAVPEFAELVEKAGEAAVSGTMVGISTKLLKGKWVSRFGNEAVEGLIIPKRTFMRRQARKQNLSADEADRALRLARIASHADRVFGAPAKADHWLSTPNPKFSGQRPLALLKTDAGAAVVEETLYQIEHGIFA